MRNVNLTHPIRQLALTLTGFVVVIVLLESDGLVSWADHLEIGPLRSAAVPATAAIQEALHPIGLAAVREQALATLARVGWTDDAALVSEATDAPRAKDLSSASSCTGLAVTNGTGGVKAGGSASGSTATNSPASLGNPYPNALGANAALLSAVPRATALSPLPPVVQGKPRVVALAGDSMMAVGISDTLMRQAAGDKNLHIVKAFRSGTGLARPEVFNWMDEYPAMLGTEKPDVVIVAIGANDGQGFVVDKKVLPYGSDGWRQVYQDRVASYLAMVSAGGARVVWLGLPPMRVPVYNDKIATINRITYSVVSQSPQATWWNPVSYVGDDAGGFREFVTSGNGKTIRIRQTDGIHLSDEGAGMLTSVLIKWLDPPVAPPAVAPVALSAPAPGQTPAAKETTTPAPTLQAAVAKSPATKLGRRGRHKLRRG